MDMLMLTHPFRDKSPRHLDDLPNPLYPILYMGGRGISYFTYIVFPFEEVMVFAYLLPRSLLLRAARAWIYCIERLDLHNLSATRKTAAQVGICRQAKYIAVQLFWITVACDEKGR